MSDYHFEVGRFRARLELHENECSVSFEAERGAQDTGDGRRISGYLRFDGCVNYEYQGSENTLLHACDVTDFDDEAAFWRRLYVEARALMPKAIF